MPGQSKIYKIDRRFDRGLIEITRGNLKAALQPLEQAAAGGHTEAMYYLGALLADSEPSAAHAWLEKAASAGNRRAVHELARMNSEEEADLSQSRPAVAQSAEDDIQPSGHA